MHACVPGDTALSGRARSADGDVCTFFLRFLFLPFSRRDRLLRGISSRVARNDAGGKISLARFLGSGRRRTSDIDGINESAACREAARAYCRVCDGAVVRERIISVFK